MCLRNLSILRDNCDRMVVEGVVRDNDDVPSDGVIPVSPDPPCRLSSPTSRRKDPRAGCSHLANSLGFFFGMIDIWLVSVCNFFLKPAFNTENKVLLVEEGALPPLVKLLRSSNKVCGCISYPLHFHVTLDPSHSPNQTIPVHFPRKRTST